MVCEGIVVLLFMVGTLLFRNTTHNLKFYVVRLERYGKQSTVPSSHSDEETMNLLLQLTGPILGNPGNC